MEKTSCCHRARNTIRAPSKDWLPGEISYEVLERYESEECAGDPSSPTRPLLNWIWGGAVIHNLFPKLTIKISSKRRKNGRIRRIRQHILILHCRSNEHFHFILHLVTMSHIGPHSEWASLCRINQSKSIKRSNLPKPPPPLLDGLDW